MIRTVCAVAVACAVALTTGCGARSTPGPAVLRDTAPPWPAPRDGLAQVQAAGLEASRLDDTTNQRRFTMELSIDAQPVPLVPYIGTDRPRALQGPVHTHDDTGAVWLEGRGADTVTLGQFFTVWGVRFTAECLGAACGDIVVTADGENVDDPQSLVLATVDELLRVEVTS